MKKLIVTIMFLSMNAIPLNVHAKVMTSDCAVITGAAAIISKLNVTNNDKATDSKSAFVVFQKNAALASSVSQGLFILDGFIENEKVRFIVRQTSIDLEVGIPKCDETHACPTIQMANKNLSSVMIRAGHKITDLQAMLCK